MPCCHIVIPLFHGPVIKDPKFNLSVAYYIWIRCPPCLIFPVKVFDNRLQRTIYPRADADMINKLRSQGYNVEKNMMQEAWKRTVAGVVEANKNERKPAPISKICIGLECGGSDGFSGISANPALGYVSDILVSLGGSVVLSEFPELCGVEQELSDSCVDEETATRFMHRMSPSNDRA